MSLDMPLEVTCNGTTVTLDPYQTALVPAVAQWCTVRSPRECSPFMLVTPPEHRELLPVRLLAAGVDQAQIDRFMEQF
jgi:hypothetical protein